MYAPTQGPVNTGFAQTEIEAKASGSDILKGQLVRVLHNADDVPTVRLTNNADRVASVPLGVAKHDFKQGYNGTVVVAGVGMVLVTDASLKTATRSDADIEIVCSDSGVAIQRTATNAKGSIPFGMTIEAKGTARDYVPVAFSGYARINSPSNVALTSISVSGDISRTAANTYIPQQGVANRILLPEKAWNPKLGSPAHVDVYRESFYQALDSSGPAGDVELKSSGVSFIINCGGYLHNNGSNNIHSMPFDSDVNSAGISVNGSSGAMTLMRGSFVDDTDDGYFVWVDYVE